MAWAIGTLGLTLATLWFSTLAAAQNETAPPRAPRSEAAAWTIYLPHLGHNGHSWTSPSLVIYDPQGNVRDWDWLYETFGDVEILHALSSPAYRVCVLRAQEWDATLQVTVLCNGIPVPGIPVVRYWPDAPVLPPELIRWTGFERGVYAVTKENGEVGFGMGNGDFYHLPDGAVSAEWVADPGVASDLVDGLGMVFGSNRLHLDVTFCLGE